MRRYLVTGGAGFIGSHIAGALLEQGASVRVFDNFSTGKRENISGLADAKNARRLEVMEADLRDADRVADAVRGIDTIFHEAAFVSVAESMLKPRECFDVNVTGTAVLLDAARVAGVQRVVIASSAAVYGDSATLPLTEDLPTRPLSPYAASKNANETYSAMYTKAFGLSVAALRYFNVYGPRQRPDSMYAAAVPIFIRRLLNAEPITIFGDGRQTRDLIFVGDVVRANLIAAEHPAAPGQVFNVSTGVETAVLDLISVLSGLYPGSPEPVHVAPRSGDIYKSLGDPSKARDLLGFRAQTSLAEGLKATLDWMQ
jgi:UDP-N-acetylglucosamine/UDP-N-acetyl-alpha-D-glucosaminouronate 4-epimerase